MKGFGVQINNRAISTFLYLYRPSLFKMINRLSTMPEINGVKEKTMTLWTRHQTRSNVITLALLPQQQKRDVSRLNGLAEFGMLNVATPLQKLSILFPSSCLIFFCSSSSIFFPTLPAPTINENKLEKLEYTWQADQDRQGKKKEGIKRSKLLWA